MVRTKAAGGSALERLREFGLRYPRAHTKSPWPGHLDLAVNDKTFAYLSVEGDPITISCKLPHSADSALSLSFTTPTAYGLGKSGWVTATFPDDAQVPVELLQEWIDESYRAQAPKRLSAGLPPQSSDMAVEATEPVTPTPRGKRAAAAPRGKRATAAPRGKRATAVPRSSTVKQRASGGASARARPAKRRPAKRRPAGAKVASGATRTKKRASVSQRAAPLATQRNPKQRRRSSA